MTIRKLRDFDQVSEFLRSVFSSPTHWPDWNILLSRYHDTNFYYLAAYDDQELMGICPVHELKKSFTSILKSGQFFYNPYGGWIFSREQEIDMTRTPLSFNQSLIGFSLPTLDEFKAKYLGESSGEFITLLVDLNKSYDEIFTKDFESRLRNTIRKAEKNDVTVKIKNDVDLFYHYYAASCIKRGLKCQSKAFFMDLFNKCVNITFEISWTMAEDQAIGMDVICFDKNYCIGLWNYIFPEAPKLGQGSLIIAESIKRSQAYGCRYFDFCFVEKERLSSIYQFKKGFSKLEEPIVYFTKKPMTYRIVNHLNH
jgi:hypothetical protein